MTKLPRLPPLTLASLVIGLVLTMPLAHASITPDATPGASLIPVILAATYAIVVGAMLMPLLEAAAIALRPLWTWLASWVFWATVRAILRRIFWWVVIAAGAYFLGDAALNIPA